MSDTNERSVGSAGSVADIIDRLLAAVKADAPMQRALVVSAAAEIERLRFAIRRLAEQDATLSVCDGNVTVTMDAPLTDAEREAVIWAAHAAKYWAMYSENHAERELFAKRGEALRWLAEKHKCD